LEVISRLILANQSLEDVQVAVVRDRKNRDPVVNHQPPIVS
jgi:hypothetical protein